jgi:ParB/RepB/Spo0J family partition protein
MPTITHIPVRRIRPEDGLGRQRDRTGHTELQRSIAQFGVLTPITVRLAPDGSGDYLLVKGQGRTLACQILGLSEIPALVVDDAFAEQQKVQQFLVENVARLKMRPVDRALLMQRARATGEETASIAARFGVRATTVRRLLAQLDGAGSQEVAALRAGEVNLALHAVLTRHISAEDRPEVLSSLKGNRIGAADMQMLLKAIGWERLVQLGPQHRPSRMRLLEWALATIDSSTRRSARDRIIELATRIPNEVPYQTALAAGGR